jgi:hypothetical protein
MVLTRLDLYHKDRTNSIEFENDQQMERLADVIVACTLTRPKQELALLDMAGIANRAVGKMSPAREEGGLVEDSSDEEGEE